MLYWSIGHLFAALNLNLIARQKSLLRGISAALKRCEKNAARRLKRVCPAPSAALIFGCASMRMPLSGNAQIAACFMRCRHRWFFTF
jgi:hypothetical protein